MNSTPFEAIYEVFLYADDILIDQFTESINVRALNTDEAYSIAKSLLYDKLTNRKPEVPYENYIVKLKSFEESPQLEAKNSYINFSTRFLLATGIEFTFLCLVLRQIIIATLLTALAVSFDKVPLSYIAYVTTVISGFVLILKYKPVISKSSYTWLHSIVLLISAIQAIIFWV